MTMARIAKVIRILLLRKKCSHPLWFCHFSRRDCRKRHLIIFLIMIVMTILTVLIAIFYFYSFYCSFEDVKKIVDIVCSKYTKNETIGSLCAELCDSHTLLPTNCISHHLGKEVVFKASYKGKYSIIKSSHLNTNSVDEVFWQNETGSKHYPSIAAFYDMLTYSVVENLNLPNGTKYGMDIIRMLWAEDVSDLNLMPESELHNVMESLWNLVQQPEYLLLKFYEKENIFPKITGNCGNVYIEEYVQPLENLFLLFYPSWRNKFADRAHIALSIIHYLELLEKRFPNLHICDMKMGHFGLADDGTIRTLDSDMVFPEKNLLQNMVLTGNCSDDIECSFIDCLGYCDNASKQCQPLVQNTNFHRVCANIFLGKFAPQYLGLLGMPPKNVQLQLEFLLRKCSSPIKRDDEQIVKNDLKKLLKNYRQL